jgi:large repetitive protein
MYPRSLRHAVVAVSAGVVLTAALVGTTQSANAATAAPSRTVASSSTPTLVIGKTAKVKAVVKPVTGASLPTGTVTFSEGTAVLGTAALALVGTVEVAKVSLPGLAVGTHLITASYGGSASFAASTSLAVTIVVTKGATSATVTTSASTTAPGRYTITAAVTNVPPAKGQPTGLVQFVVDENAPQLVSLTTWGKAHLTTTFVVGTSHTVTVTYQGDATFATSTGSVTFTA